MVTFGQNSYTVNEFEDVPIRVLVTTALTSSIQIGIFTSTSATAEFAISTYTTVSYLIVTRGTSKLDHQQESLRL